MIYQEWVVCQAIRTGGMGLRRMLEGAGRWGGILGYSEGCHPFIHRGEEDPSPRSGGLGGGCSARRKAVGVPAARF